MPNRFFPETKSFFKIFEVVVFVVGTVVFSTSAEAGFQSAGFQWVAPTEQAAPPAMPNGQTSAPIEMAPMMPAAPSVSVTPLAGENPEVISPIVIQGQSPPPPPLAAMPSMPAPAAPMSGSSLAAMPAPQAETTVQGFASNVPLAVALRQILPPGYGFSIDQDVDLGTLVSFTGGQPWRDTLQNMLQPANLSMREQGQMIAIGRAQDGVTAPPPEIAAAAPVVMPTPLTAPVQPPYPAAPGVTPPRPIAAMNKPKPELTQPTMPPLHLAPSSSMAMSSIVDTWAAARGDTLHKVLDNWSRRAGVELNWLAEYDYPLQASVSYNGTFEDAVRSLLSGFEEAHPQPIAALHANAGAGQTVLVVETRGNSYSD